MHYRFKIYFLCMVRGAGRIGGMSTYRKCDGWVARLCVYVCMRVMKKQDNETKHPGGSQKEKCQPLAPSPPGDGYSPATQLSVSRTYTHTHADNKPVCMLFYRIC